MSTAERMAGTRDVWALPAASTALVPLAGDRGPRLAGPRADPGPMHAHRWFFGLWYVGVALFPAGAFLGARSGDAMLALLLPAILVLGLGGLGIMVHVLYRPAMQKLRKALGALAALVLSLASMEAIADAAREVHAVSRIAALQPLADDLAADGRIRRIGVPNAGWVELNDFSGRLDGSYDSAVVPGSAPRRLADVLRDDGISRRELARLMRRLDEAGVRRVDVGEAFVAMEGDASDLDLLYVRPGHALPPPGGYGLDGSRARTKPLGGGWYLLGGSTVGD